MIALQELTESLSLRTLLPVAVVGILVAGGGIFALRARMQASIHEEAVRDAAVIAERPILRAIGPQDLAGPIEGPRFEDVDGLVRRVILPQGIERLKLWSAEGTVVYSVLPEQIGASFPDREPLKTALGGTSTYRVSHEPESLMEREPGELLEVYIPLTWEPGVVAGAVEVYLPHGPYEAQLSAITTYIFLVVLSSSLALTVALYVVFRTVWRAIRKERDAAVRRDLERKRALEALQESEERQRSIVESAQYAIVSIDSYGLVTSWNSAAEKMFGYAEAEVIGEQVTGLMPERYRDAHIQALRRLREGGEPRVAGSTTELEGLRRSGAVFPIELSLSAWDSRAGQFHTGVIRDITERKQAEERIREAGRLLSIGELSAGVAHELNNPLGSITLFSELLLSEDLPEAARDDVRKIQQDAQRAAKIVRGLLSFSRSHEPEKRFIDLRDVIKKAMELKAHDFRTANIEATMEWSGQIPHTLADEYQMLEVLVNILTNAEQAMAEAHGRGRLIVRAETSGDRIRIIIGDDGPGIAPEQLGRIFDPFFSTKGQGKGTGLGLSISHGIVSQHGGRLWAESHIGEGATFYVELPILGQDEPPEPQPSP